MLKVPDSRLPWLLVLFAALIPLVPGLALVHWQAAGALSDRAAEHAQVALGQFDDMLDNVAQSADALLPLAGRPCAEVTLPLREQVTRRPFVRSTNLVRDDRLYCSSLFGDFDEPLDVGQYVDGRLRLMAGNPVTPGQALLILRTAQEHTAALATLDGFHLANALRMIAPDGNLRLAVGNAWLDRLGHVHDEPALPDEEAAVRLTSSHYPIAVLAGYPSGTIWRHAIEDYPALILLLLALSVGAALGCRALLAMTRSPRAELARALAAGEFVPWLQPVIDSADGRWAGAEILMRWQHPREGLVRPDLFIPLAEDSGLIVPMTRQLMQDTAEQLARLAPWLPEGFHLGFNLAADHCLEPSLIGDCQALLERLHHKPTLVLELTERQLVEPLPQTLALFERLRSAGVRLAVDDFGTGQSSLAYLHQFHFDYLKIDQSFVRRIDSDALSAPVLDTVIDLCARLKLDIVAEGVETLAQQEYLRAAGVRYLQGYRFGKPMPLEVFVKTLRVKMARPERAGAGLSEML